MTINRTAFGLSLSLILLPIATANNTQPSSIVQNVGGHLHETVAGQSCCSKLSATLHRSVSYFPDPIYRQEQNGTNSYGYWSSRESEQRPLCRVTPRNTKEVASAVHILSTNNCVFAIRSGGHTPWPNASNIDGHTSIDLSCLNNISISHDNQSASMGPGARWEDVYRTLTPHGLAVSGGRVSRVGVGGLTLGGGKSFFASLHGFAADNVLQYEVVLANGTIAYANHRKNPDLYRALKGGSNNFGIVTRFDVVAFNQGPLWAGQVVYPVSTLPQQLDALASFTKYQGDHPNAQADAQIIFAFVTSNTYQIVANFYSYTEPVPHPPAFTNFSAIKPEVSNTTRIDSLANFSVELNTGSPNGKRYLFATATFANNRALYSDLIKIANDTFVPFQKRGTADILLSFVLQPLTRPMLRHGCGAGGNVLGLCGEREDLMILDLTMQWGDKKDDKSIDEAARKLIAAVNAAAEKYKVRRSYEYLNYAAPWQMPIASYGLENVKFLKKVGREYDPSGVFQRLVPGGYKLPK